MAKTIGQLTSATTIGNGDLFVIEQSSQTKKIAASVVRGGLINADVDAAAAIVYSKLDLEDSIVAGDLTADAVTTAKIDDDAVTTAKIDDDAVTTAKILDANVTTGKVADAAITAPKLSGAQTGSAPIYGCRAWVNFDGTRNEGDTGASANGANVKIRASGNVASVLKNSAGNYTITFTTAISDANYCVTTMCGQDDLGANSGYSQASAGNLTTTTCKVFTRTVVPAATDVAIISVSVFR